MPIVDEVHAEFRSLRDEHGTNLFFYQYPFTAGRDADALGRELANLIWNEAFRSHHVPAFLRMSSLAQWQWQADFWIGFAAPFLARFCDVEPDYFYNTAFNTNGYWFFNAFKIWCQKTQFGDRNLYNHYTSFGSNMANWRVNLIQDQIGLIQGDDLPSSFFNDLRLWSLVNIDDQFFSNRFDQLINQVDRQTQAQWIGRRHFMIDLGCNLARLAANIKFPADGSDLDANQISDQANELKDQLGFSDVMLRRLCRIYRFLNLGAPPASSGQSPRMLFLNNPYSGLMECDGHETPSLLGQGNGPIRVQLENLQDQLLGLVYFSLQSENLSIPVSSNHSHDGMFEIRGGNGANGITGFGFWDQLTLRAEVKNHPAIRINPKELRWSAPGMFRRAGADPANQFFRRIPRNQTTSAMLGETMLLVPACHGKSPIITPNTAAAVIPMGNGLFKVTIAGNSADIPDNCITISSDQVTWEFIIVVPSASIRVASGEEQKVVGFVQQSGDDQGGLVLARNNLPDFEVTPWLPDGWQEMQDGPLNTGGSVVVLDGKGPTAREVSRLEIPGLLSPDAAQHHGQPAPQRITLEPLLLAASGSHVTLAIEDSQQRRLGEEISLKLDMGIRNEEKSLAIFRATAMELVDCLERPDSVHKRQSACPPVTENQMKIRDSAIISMDGKSIILRGFQPYRATGVRLENFGAGDPAWSLHDLNDWIEGWLPPNGHFRIAAAEVDDAELSLLGPDSSTVLNLRIKPGARRDGFQSYSFKDFDHDLGEPELRDRLAGLLSHGEFRIKFHSRHIFPAIDLLVVKAKPVITQPVAFEEGQNGTEARVTLDCHHANGGARIVLQYWPAGENGVQPTKVDIPLEQSPTDVSVLIGSPVPLPPLELGELQIGRWAYKLLWKPSLGNAVALQIGHFEINASLGQLERLLHIGNEPGREWDAPLNSAEWRRGRLHELSCKVEYALQKGIDITKVVQNLRQEVGIGWPWRAIRRLRNWQIPMGQMNHENMIWRWADDIWEKIGHPDNPIISPTGLGFERNADTGMAIVAAALVAEHGNLFARANKLMHLDANAIGLWVDLIDCWQQRDGRNHLEAVRNQLQGYLGQGE